MIARCERARARGQRTFGPWVRPGSGAAAIPTRPITVCTRMLAPAMGSDLFDRLTALPEESPVRARVLQLLGAHSMSGALVRLQIMSPDERGIYEQGIARILTAGGPPDMASATSET